MQWLRIIAVLCAILLSIPQASARPEFILLDVSDRQNRPADLGIHVTARRIDSEIHFRVDLDSKASSAVQSASVFFTGPERKRPAFAVERVQKRGGGRLFTFRIPERYLKPRVSDSLPGRPITVHCFLHLSSAPIRQQDEIINFNAYRLRLDNVPAE